MLNPQFFHLGLLLKNKLLGTYCPTLFHQFFQLGAEIWKKYLTTDFKVAISTYTDCQKYTQFLQI